MKLWPDTSGLANSVTQWIPAVKIDSGNMTGAAVGAGVGVTAMLSLWYMHYRSYGGTVIGDHLYRSPAPNRKKRRERRKQALGVYNNSFTASEGSGEEILSELEAYHRDLPPFLVPVPSFVEEGVPSSQLPIVPRQQSLSFDCGYDLETDTHPADMACQRFGRAFGIEHFQLNPDMIHLNHGAYGGTLKVCGQSLNHWREAMESNPTDFMERQLIALLLNTQRELAEYVNADPKDLAFVPNTTTGVSTVLKSLNLKMGDSILMLSTTYLAVKNCMEATVAKAGATLIEVPVKFPIDERTLLKSIKDHIQPSTKFAIFDHITSPTAVILPVDQLVDLCRKKHILVMIDGAHALGQLPLDIKKLCPDFYVANAHKWLCTAKGSAMLYVRRPHQGAIHPLVTSHGFGHGFLREFTWTGTSDYTPFLTIHDALEFRKAVGEEQILDYQKSLSQWLLTYGCAKFRTMNDLCSDMGMMCNMIVLKLPERFKERVAMNGFQLREHLRVEQNIMSTFFVHERSLYVRLSVQIYNEKSDYIKFIDLILNLIETGYGDLNSHPVWGGKVRRKTPIHDEERITLGIEPATPTDIPTPPQTM
eukprot:GFYU01002903.1.p1 GENE.GFYU01002903.1~~GFYU01002903.1.p1  ORF type:complete len:590 (-),score=112.20 GFYU01002903.1:106-1875(-)